MLRPLALNLPTPVLTHRLATYLRQYSAFNLCTRTCTIVTFNVRVRVLMRCTRSRVWHWSCVDETTKPLIACNWSRSVNYTSICVPTKITYIFSVSITTIFNILTLPFFSPVLNKNYNFCFNKRWWPKLQNKIHLTNRSTHWSFKVGNDENYV